jgi:SAM-dependent methyltransferase
MTMSELVRLNGNGLTPSLEAEVVARMEVARDMLAQAKTVGDAKRVADQAAAICEYLRRQADVGLYIVNDGLLLRLQAEARMGEFLKQPGAVKGDGRPPKPCQPDTVSVPTYKDLGIARKSAQRYREVASVPPETLLELAEEATRIGRELTRESVIKVARKFKPPAPATNGNGHHPETPPTLPPAIPAEFHNAVITGDARKLAKRIPDGSVAVCLCDPVYERAEDYEWLARECERVLVPGGNLIAQCGNLRRFECEVAMRRSGLSYVELLAEVYPYALCPIFPLKLQIGWKPYLWFTKGEPADRLGEWVVNRVHAKGKRSADASKDLHEWGDAEEFALGLLQRLIRPGDVVWDPFTGSGTVPVVCKRLGLPFVAFEIDPESAENARQRIAGTRRSAVGQTSLCWDEEAAAVA